MYSPSSTDRMSRRNFVSTCIVRSGHAWLRRGEKSTPRRWSEFSQTPLAAPLLSPLLTKGLQIRILFGEVNRPISEKSTPQGSEAETYSFPVVSFWWRWPASVGSTSVITGAGGKGITSSGRLEECGTRPSYRQGPGLATLSRSPRLDAGSTVLPCHDRLPLSSPVCGATWRFPPRKFYGSAFAAVMDAMRCSGSVRIVIGASTTVARVAGQKHGCSSTAAPTAGISGVPKAASIIVIASGGIVVGHTHP
jgi:hypothetical protein